MKVWLAFIILLMIYQDDAGGSPTVYRRYQNVVIPPYHPTEKTQASFQFSNTFQDAITLSWRITNTKYYQALIYTQSYTPRSLIQRTIDLPRSLFDGGVSTIHLIASRTNFSSSIDLKVYPQTSMVISQFDKAFFSTNTISRIDSYGFIIYEREHLSFQAMGSYQTYPVYGRFDLSPIQLRIHTPVAREIIYTHARLLIANHPTLEGLALHDNTFRVINLLPILQQQTIHLQLPTLYVHPQTLTPSAIPVNGYVPTKFLFLPIQSFLDLKSVVMKLELAFKHFHNLTIEYAFEYVANKAIFGSCLQSQTCVKIYD